MKRFFRRLLAIKVPLPPLKFVVKSLFFLGIGSLVFLLGAAVMHFQLPPWDFLRKAFIEVANNTSKLASKEKLPEDLGESVSSENPAKTFDGFTLVTTTHGPWAALLNMKGEIVYRWELPFQEARDKLPNVQYPPIDSSIHWFGSHLFPNGDLLAVYHGEGITPYGCGLIKLDKESNLLWAFAANVHHEFDVAEDGTIYALTQELADELPKGVKLSKREFIADHLVVLSPDGKKQQSLSILDALQNSQYSLFFKLIDEGYLADTGGMQMGTDTIPPFTTPPGNNPFKKGSKNPQPPTFEKPPVAGVGPPIAGGKPPSLIPKKGFFSKGDYTHANSVRYISRTMAAKFPLFKQGQVLISLRNMDALAVIDIPSRSVVWAARGLWRQQHSPQLLDNGHILLFDNLGSSMQARIIEYDPVTQAIPWFYSNESNTYRMKAAVRGSVQRLPNGNTLFSDPDHCRLVEVTPEREIVWDCTTLKKMLEDENPISRLNITSMWRFGENELTFLDGGTRARPK